MTAKISFTAGALFRRHVRQQAALLGLDVQEFKGWLSSGFVVSGPSDDVKLMHQWLERIAAQEVEGETVKVRVRK